MTRLQRRKKNMQRKYKHQRGKTISDNTYLVEERLRCITKMYRKDKIMGEDKYVEKRNRKKW